MREHVLILCIDHGVEMRNPVIIHRGDDRKLN